MSITFGPVIPLIEIQSQEINRDMERRFAYNAIYSKANYNSKDLECNLKVQ